MKQNPQYTKHHSRIIVKQKIHLQFLATPNKNHTSTVKTEHNHRPELWMTFVFIKTYLLHLWLFRYLWITCIIMIFICLWFLVTLIFACLSHISYNTYLYPYSHILWLFIHLCHTIPWLFRNSWYKCVVIQKILIQMCGY